MDTEFFKYLTTLGVGGILAGFMFHFYRQDVKVYTDLWRGQADALMLVVKDNTAALTKLITLVDALHSRLDRDRDRQKDERHP